MYYMLENETFDGRHVRHIIRQLGDFHVESFIDTETNDGPERAAYLKWVAEGNTPEPWQPDSES